MGVGGAIAFALRDKNGGHKDTLSVPGSSEDGEPERVRKGNSPAGSPSDDGHTDAGLTESTAAATRGLDFPQVTDVFNLGIVGSAADYVHRAGRVGRVGQLSRGVITSVLCPSEVRALIDLGQTLRFTPIERAPPMPVSPLSPEMERDDAVQALEEVLLLDSQISDVENPGDGYGGEFWG